MTAVEVIDVGCRDKTGVEGLASNAQCVASDGSLPVSQGGNAKDWLEGEKNLFQTSNPK